MVGVPFTDERLAALRQIGVEHLVLYDMSNARNKLGKLPEIVARAKQFGLAVPVVESGPAIDRIVLGKDGWEVQIDEWVSLLGFLGRNGVEVVCYNFMPQVTADAMVVRTDFAARTRGGALTSAFRLSDLHANTVPHDEAPIGADRMRENLARFIKSVVPAAEAAGVKLAMHPDDPPLTPICGLPRIMSSTEDFDWLISLNSSPANGMTFCAGCFAEMREDLPSLVRKYGERIHYVHFRNIRTKLGGFIETFPDDGEIDLGAIIEALEQVGYVGYARPDHAPLLAGEAAVAEGYGFQGHIFTLGYLRGLLDSVGHRSSKRSGERPEMNGLVSREDR